MFFGGSQYFFDPGTCAYSRLSFFKMSHIKYFWFLQFYIYQYMRNQSDPNLVPYHLILVRYFNSVLFFSLNYIHLGGFIVPPMKYFDLCEFKPLKKVLTLNPYNFEHEHSWKLLIYCPVCKDMSCTLSDVICNYFKFYLLKYVFEIA